MNFSLATMLAFMLCVNIVLWWGQTGITAMANDAEVVAPIFFTYDGSPISDMDAGDYTVPQDATQFIPSGSGQVEVDGGNVFTDTFGAIRNWFMESTGVKYIVGYFSAIPSFLKGIKLPTEIAYGLGILWHAISAIILISFIAGRS